MFTRGFCMSPSLVACARWADANSKDNSNADGKLKVLKVSTAVQIERVLRAKGLKCHIECVIVENRRKRFQRDAASTPGSKSFYIRVARKGGHLDYAKRDIWALSPILEFHSDSTVLACSVFYGPNGDGEIELRPIGKPPFRLSEGTVLYAINCFNAESEMSWIDNIDSCLRASILPLMPTLLKGTAAPPRSSWHIHAATVGRGGGFSVPRAVAGSSTRHHLQLTMATVLSTCDGYIKKYTLNHDQGAALQAVATMLPCVDEATDTGTPAPTCPVVLVHGVFGSGKSYFVAVLIMFLDEVFAASGATQGASDWKMFLSSSTNVAVDRILLSLLDLGFNDFVRVGSAKRIAPRVLPYSTHGASGDKKELSDLQMLLKEEGITPTDKRCIRDSIGKLKRGENAQQLSSTRVVAATLASTGNEVLKGLQFAFQIQDEVGWLLCRVGVLRASAADMPSHPPPTHPCSDGAYARVRALSRSYFSCLRSGLSDGGALCIAAHC